MDLNIIASTEKLNRVLWSGQTVRIIVIALIINSSSEGRKCR